MIEIINSPVLTDKAIRILESYNQYSFNVKPEATKRDIKSLVESLFQVKVVSVNTHRLPRKKKRMGTTQGYRSRWKRAIVTLRSGDSIQVLPTENIQASPTEKL
uniref:ribosomal protein L23 n=1 Tax=Streptofilum capillatum TaxID=2058781 RepID=UPI00286B20C2|nr:ribosomal protein L23 [Streptofilum capillatum]WKT08568.1 ribosomal protein L23 [Streptofilum capillatum]WKT08667.1 ribosomal protein L23 [Streptofilum sp. BC4-VF8pt]WKT08766.1 ribosomal protein L23 [Streptofilum sp. ZNP2-VF4pt]